LSTIRVTGYFDNSGYGYANKQLLSVLLKTEHRIVTNILNTPMSRAEFAQDELQKEVVARLSPNIKVDVNIVQVVPFLCDYRFQKGARNILTFFWETDRICQNWIDIINNGLTTEIWVPCPSNYDALMRSGIKKPVYIVPQYIKTNMMDKEKAKRILPVPCGKDTYCFYSVFQWSLRKNPEALFKAYFNEFIQENVMLVVKTYGQSPFSDRRWIKEFILDMKEKSGSKAPVYLFGELLQPDQIDAIAPQCHCYVYTGRGEGLNIPLVSALEYKQQVITTKTGGIVDWITDESAYIIPHKLIPVDTAGQAWGTFYVSDPPQQWGDIMVEDVQRAMRKAYIERNDYSYRIKNYDNILNVGKLDNVVNLIKERLSNK